MAYDKEELFNLPVAEKYELVLDLWESIHEDFLKKEMLSSGFKNEIEKRNEKIEKNSETLVPWEEVLKQMKD